MKLPLSIWKRPQSRNLGGYILTLLNELGSEDRDVNVRQAAGLAVKNALHAKDAIRQTLLAQEWNSIDIQLRQTLKQTALNALASKEQRVGSTVAQVVSAMAQIELPREQWPELIPALLSNMTRPDTSDNLRKSTLEALGFICEEIDPHLLTYRSNEILTAVSSGARKEEPNHDIRLAAITALYNSLEFVRENFEREAERNYIMQIVCEATQCADVRVRVGAFECLVQVMHLYYDKMALYMSQALCGLTFQGMKSPEESVALQAIEFWSTVCDEEIELNAEIEEAISLGEEPSSQLVHHYFARTYVPHLIPVLTDLLTKQEEYDDEDTWNVAMASATCLSLMASCVGDIVVDYVLPFVQQHIQDPNWALREAAVMAFGSVLEGPSEEHLRPLVQAAFPVLLGLTRDPVVQVKDTAAWTLGRICYSVPNTLDLLDPYGQNARLQELIMTLLTGLRDAPRVAANCAWTIMNLAEYFERRQEELDQEGSTGGEMTKTMAADERPPGSALAPYMVALIESLLAAPLRQDCDESNLRTCAYESLSSLVQHAPRELFMTVNPLAAILERLKYAVQMEEQIIGTEQRMKHTELQASLCACMQNIIRKMGAEFKPFADDLMATLLKMFHASLTRQGTLLEEGLLVVGTLTTALDTEFERYMEAFAPFLYAALRNHAEHQVCSIAVGIVGDLCRALNKKILPYCQTFMNLLLQDLQSPQLHRDVKPPILACFGDIALATAADYVSFLEVSMQVLAQASQTKAPEDDPEMIDYVEILRENILAAYTGIVQGLKTDSHMKSNRPLELLFPYVEFVMGFLHEITQDTHRSEALTRAATGLLGDLADAFGSSIAKYLRHPWVEELLRQCKASPEKSTKELGKWARIVIKNATS